MKSDGEFDGSEATRKYFEELDYPVMMNIAAHNSFFLLSTPELSGSPPRRVAPSVVVKEVSDPSQYPTKPTHNMPGRETKVSGTESIIGDFAVTDVSCQQVIDADMLCLGLPALSTGILKDCLMMICEKQRMRCFLLLSYSLEMGA